MSREQEGARRTIAVVLGAGQGTRMGKAINKVFLPLDGKPIITYSIEAFEHCAAIDEILLVAAKGEVEQLMELANTMQKVHQVIAGGASRHASEQQALEALRSAIEANEVDVVLIHDGARPFISSEKVEQLVTKAKEVGAAILAAPLEEEEQIVQVNDKLNILKSFEGQQVYRAQTPQAFRASLLLEAYDQAAHDAFEGTDTASSLERLGLPVAIVESDATNIKITTAHDLFHAEKLVHHKHLT